MELSDYRSQIEQIDRRILALFEERMALCRAVGQYKAQNGLPIRDEALEQQKLQRLTAEVTPELQDYCRELFSCLFTLSRDLQGKEHR